MNALVILLALSDVTLATAVFIAWARPDVVIGVSLRLFGMGDHWFQEHVGDEELERLRKMARLLAMGGVVAVFAWSFAVGAIASTLRLSGA
ncbi:MAG: hypothetical protein H6741_11120 [Alphaproteobacteria bacterium]|nr:hypothetical protein [Alphaproteobacteria bacterium]MCB9793267.1 hypothetical protein [Alphaproteobacteria bacterium]